MSTLLTTDQDLRRLRSTKFPAEFDKKVDMSKVNVPVMKKWVSDETARILGTEDDIVPELVFNLLEGSENSGDSPDIKMLQISLSGFLDKDAPSFCLKLWQMCLSAQDSPQGIPKQLLEAKKKELINEKMQEDRARAEALKRQDADHGRDRDMAQIRGRERDERNGRYSQQNRRDRSWGRPRRVSRSRSPMYRPRDGDRYYREPPPRNVDSWVPSRPRDDRRVQYRRRSPSRSPSRSPPPSRRRRRSSPRSRSRSSNARRPRRRSPSPRSSQSRSRSRSRTHTPSRRRRTNARSYSRSRSRGNTRRDWHDRNHKESRLRKHRSRSSSRHRSPSPKRSRQRSRSFSPDRRKALRHVHDRSPSRSRSRSRSGSGSRSRSPAPKRRRRNSSSLERSPKRRDLLSNTRPARDSARLSQQPSDQSD